jgi:hypothetical protein
LSQDGNSHIDSWAEQNIRLHSDPGLDQSLAAGAGAGIEILPGWLHWRECLQHFMRAVLGSRVEALRQKCAGAMM